MFDRVQKLVAKLLNVGFKLPKTKAIRVFCAIAN